MHDKPYRIFPNPARPYMPLTLCAHAFAIHEFPGRASYRVHCATLAANQPGPRVADLAGYPAH